MLYSFTPELLDPSLSCGRGQHRDELMRQQQQQHSVLKFHGTDRAGTLAEAASFSLLL